MLQVTEVLLRVNDDLNNAFLRYDRLERVINMSASNAAHAKSSSPSPVRAAGAAGGIAAGAAGGAVSKHPPPPASTEDSLIDFGSSDPPMAPPVTGNALVAHMDKMNITPASNISNVKDVPQSSKGEVMVLYFVVNIAHRSVNI